MTKLLLKRQAAYLRANLINFELKDGYLALKIKYSSEWLEVCVLKV